MIHFTRPPEERDAFAEYDRVMERLREVLARYP